MSNRGLASLIAIALLAPLFALRVFWVPLHLIAEHHDHPHPGLSDTCPCGPLEAAHEPVDVGHEHEHEHEPHPSADHRTELVASRTSQDLELACVPLGSIGGAEARSGPIRRVVDDPERVPLPRPPRACRARSPPALERAAHA